MNSSTKSAVSIVLLTLLAACGGGGSGGSGATLPPVPNPTPPPLAGVIGDGSLGELAEWAIDFQGVPAIGIVIVANGQVAEIGVAGGRSVTDPALVTESDKWHIGSLTKAVTSTLAGVLVDQSIISWDTTPLDIWPELASTMHAGFTNITLRQLLSHTSGMRRADQVPIEFDQNAPGTAMERRRQYAAVLLAEPPAGLQGVSSYSNGGYIVAGAMMESIMSTPWEDLVRQQVFGPLAMLESGFGAPGSADTVDQPWGHWDRGSFFEAVPPGPGADNPDTMGPAGTVHATLADYGQFMAAHIAGARGIPGLLTAETFTDIHSPAFRGPALGWGVTEFADWAQGPVLTHNGSNLRWYSVVRLAPALDAGVMIVTNAGPGRAEAAIDSLDDLILERFEASR